MIESLMEDYPLVGCFDSSVEQWGLHNYDIGGECYS